MKRIGSLLLLLLLIGSNLIAQEKQVKNVILLIPDGTSLSAVSAARWYQRYNHPELPHLNLDPYLCGTILTYSSDAPIGDSAPTTSCYMTGHPSRAGFVATYPPADSKNDIVPNDPERAYQPMMTLLEAARITQNKATGLVFTCEFTHATPADCASHSYNRGNYEWIAPQMVHNNIDVVLGGGVKLLNPDMKTYLEREGYGVFLNDLNSFRTYNGNKMWALFRDMDMPYELDRDPSLYPSLAEMARKAIDKLSENENGFILMIEGSKVDWAAHANDAAALITDMVAFDKACGVAFDFAEKNGETLVVVVPDHGNSGFSIGTKRCPGYSHLSKEELFGPVSQFKTSVDGLIAKLHDTDVSQLKDVVYDLTGISLSDDEYTQILQCSDYNRSSLSDEERMKGSKLTKVLANMLTEHTCFGFTTTGHTGEEVFLAVFDPRAGQRLMGHHTNIELHQYLRNAAGLGDLDALTNEYFAKHTDVFAGYPYTITTKNGVPTLEVKKDKKNTLEIQAGSNILKHNGKEVKLSSVVVHVDKNNTFYLPKSLKDLFTVK